MHIFLTFQMILNLIVLKNKVDHLSLTENNKPVQFCFAYDSRTWWFQNPALCGIEIRRLSRVSVWEASPQAPRSARESGSEHNFPTKTLRGTLTPHIHSWHFIHSRPTHSLTFTPRDQPYGVINIHFHFLNHLKFCQSNHSKRGCAHFLPSIPDKNWPTVTDEFFKRTYKKPPKS